jgi:hypothetical protein
MDSGRVIVLGEAGVELGRVCAKVVRPGKRRSEDTVQDNALEVIAEPLNGWYEDS